MKTFFLVLHFLTGSDITLALPVTEAQCHAIAGQIAMGALGPQWNELLKKHPWTYTCEPQTYT